MYDCSLSFLMISLVRTNQVIGHARKCNQLDLVMQFELDRCSSRLLCHGGPSHIGRHCPMKRILIKEDILFNNVCMGLLHARAVLEVHRDELVWRYMRL